MRFLLGVAEAGFFPGIVLYLSYWFPAAERARAVALFMTATAMSGVIGGPLSGALLELDGALGFRGWQWLFVVEGIPAVVLGFVVLRFLTDRPEDAQWLPEDERRRLVARLAAEREAVARRHGVELRRALAHPRVWALSLYGRRPTSRAPLTASSTSSSVTRCAAMRLGSISTLTVCGRSPQTGMFTTPSTAIRRNLIVQ